MSHREYKPLKLGRLAKALGVSSEDYPEFKSVFDKLRKSRHVVIGAGALISLPGMTGKVTGVFRANPKGFGFVVPLELNAHGDLFIPPVKEAEKQR